MRPIAWLLALAALLAVGGAALLTHREAQAGEPEIEVLPDIVYTTVRGDDLKLDLARPRGARGAAPCVVVIHGGGWAFGSRKMHGDLIRMLARRGYVAATVSYRFAPIHPWPAQILDVKAAVRFLRTNAERYGLDAAHFGAIGFSAGGHLALLLGTADPGDGLEGDAAKDAPSSKVQSVVSWFGPTDLDAADYPPSSKALIDGLLGDAARRIKGKGDACPIHYVDAGDAPMLLLHGTRDPIVPVTQATRMSEALTAAGVKGEVHLLLGEGHGWMGTTLTATVEDSLRWFDRTLKGVVAAGTPPR